ncbi:MAG: Holliday junction resolvase RuvX [Gammaproteobacteria bacterium]
MLALGFDFGLRRIGVAVGSRLGGQARALTTVGYCGKHPDWTRLEEIVTEWKPDRLIVGLPYNIDGSESDSSRAARRFAGRLQQHCRIPVELVDERLSSREAEQRLKSERRSGARKKRVQATDVDQEAAAVILQGWLDQPRRQGDEK